MAETFQRAIIVEPGEIVLEAVEKRAPKVRADILEMTEESFDDVVRTDLRGTMFMTQAVARQMLRQPLKGDERGTIINIGSASWDMPIHPGAERFYKGIGVLK